ncbi:MAG: subclass B3 metallo-beta-lactamase [Hyphomicrobiales bacterium]|nr:MAG: subclass B3 metallo-beta-lactamase [Hyphomicrobiales bacterium]
MALTLRILSLVTGLLVGASASAQTPAPPPSLTDAIKARYAAWNAPTEPFKIIGNVHYVGTNGLASYLITSPAGHVLVDTGLREANPQIKANIAKLGFQLADVKVLLNTHAHFDHTAGLADLKAETGAQMVAGEVDKPLLEGGYYPNNSDPRLRFEPVKVDRTVKTGDVVEIGPIRMTAISTPGHSPGCTSWSLNVKDGDATRSVLIFCSATVALNRLVGTPTHATIVDDYRKTFAWAKTVSPDVFLAPHPEMYGMAEKRALMGEGKPNPFVDKAAFGAYIAKLEAAFEDGLKKQQAETAKN